VQSNNLGLRISFLQERNHVVSISIYVFTHLKLNFLHATHGSISIIEITENKWHKPEFSSFSEPKAKKNYRKGGAPPTASV
jgi:hypothetical protein